MAVKKLSRSQRFAKDCKLDWSDLIEGISTRKMMLQNKVRKLRSDMRENPGKRKVYVSKIRKLNCLVKLKK